MNIELTAIVNFPVDKILDDVGVGKDPAVQKFIVSEVARHMDPYVPMDSSVLKNTRKLGDDYVLFDTPYARNMYFGKVMVDPVTGAAGFLTKDGWRSRRDVKKVVSNREYKYQGAPMRGKLWDKRMWADKKDVITKTIAELIKRRLNSGK